MHQRPMISTGLRKACAPRQIEAWRFAAGLLILMLAASDSASAQGASAAAGASLTQSTSAAHQPTSGHASVDLGSPQPRPISGSFSTLGTQSLFGPAPPPAEVVELSAQANEAVQAGALQPSAIYDDLSHGVESAPLPVSMEGRFDGPHTWHRFPAGLMYRSYVAGEREPRIAGVWLNERDRGMVLETALGGRAGLIRYGTGDSINPQGFQLDLEGAGLARVDPEEHSDLEGTDYRFGCVGTWQFSPWAYKAGYYHLSSHMGDEFMVRTGATSRRNYVRDSLIFGARYDYTDDVNLYGEIGYAANHNGGAEPLEFQFGAEFNPKYPTGPYGSPVMAINGHLREEFDFGGSVNVVWGWQWKGETGSAFRVGMQYYNGPSIQWEFFDQHEELLGGGMWFDF